MALPAHWICHAASACNSQTAVCSGDQIAEVRYLPEEVATWGIALEQLRDLVPRYGCAEFVRSYRGMHFEPERVPQLQEVHERLQAATGWSIRPVAGLMHPRDFLNGLAFKTFHSTQYMRHHSNPVYTPEPDLVHELLGAPCGRARLRNQWRRTTRLLSTRGATLQGTCRCC